MNNFATTSMLLKAPPLALGFGHNASQRDNHRSGRSHRSLLKTISGKKDEIVPVLCPDNVAVEFIDSKAAIDNPRERRRIARREQRRDRSNSTTSESQSEEDTAEVHEVLVATGHESSSSSPP